MGGVVVDGTNDDTAGPGSGVPERLSFDLSDLIAGMQVLHLPGVTRVQPLEKILQFREVANRGDAREIKSGPASSTLHQFSNVANREHTCNQETKDEQR